MNHPEIKLSGAYGRNFGSKGKLQDINGICDTLQAAMGAGGGNVPIIIVADNKKRLRKDIKELDRYCEYCGNKLERKRFNGRLEDFTVFSNRKYCNRECMKRDYLKIGEHDQSYSNAHTTARKINELILHKEVCELCGSDTNLDIHHIDENWQNNNFDNLICLCRSCHMKEHTHKGKCTICGKPQKGHGYCNKHYLRFKKYGDPLYTKYNMKKEGDVNE